MSYGGRLFDYDEASAAVHHAYSPDTIEKFCSTGVLRVGEHWIYRYIVAGPRHWTKRLLHARGIEALFARLSQRIPSNHGQRARGTPTGNVSPT